LEALSKPEKCEKWKKAADRGRFHARGTAAKHFERRYTPTLIRPLRTH
jgi:hypothetical protein